MAVNGMILHFADLRTLMLDLSWTAGAGGAGGDTVGGTSETPFCVGSPEGASALASFLSLTPSSVPAEQLEDFLLLMLVSRAEEKVDQRTKMADALYHPERQGMFPQTDISLSHC